MFLIFVSEIISDSPLGKDELRLGGVLFYLFAQAANVHVHRAQIAQIVVLPDGFQKLFAAENRAAIRGEQLQKVELLGREVDFLLADGDRAAVGVEGSFSGCMWCNCRF